MPGYVVVNVEVTDPQGYEEYKSLASALIAEHGGRYLARGGEAAAVEGDWLPRFVVVEFPSYEAAQRFYHSPGYRAAAAVRQRCSRSSVAIVDGAPQAP